MVIRSFWVFLTLSPDVSKLSPRGTDSHKKNQNAPEGHSPLFGVCFATIDLLLRFKDHDEETSFISHCCCPGAQAAVYFAEVLRVSSIFSKDTANPSHSLH